MAIAYDTHSTPGVVADNTTQQWTHTPIGVPKGALCLVAEDNNSGSSTVVRYNGVTMPNSPSSPTELDSAQDSTLRAHFLGASLPAGSVTVEISGNGGGSFWYPVLITMTALGDTEIVSDAVAQQNPAGATLAVGGAEVFAAEVFARTTGIDDLRPGWSVIAQATMSPFTVFIATQAGSSDMAIGGTMGASSTHVLAVAMRDTDAGGTPDPALLTPSRVDAAAEVRAPTVAATPQAVQPLSTAALAEVLGAALVAAGIISPARISASAAVAAPGVQATAVPLQLARIEASAELRAPTIVAGIPAGVLGPQRIAAAADVRAPVVVAEPVSVQPARLEAAAVVAQPDVSAGTAGVTMRPGRIEAAAAIGQGSVVPGSATIGAQRVEADAAIGEPTVQVAPAMIVVERIEVPAEVYAASVIGGPGRISATRVEAGASVGNVMVLRGGLEPLERVERTLLVRTGIERSLVVASSIERTLTVTDRIERTLEV